MVMFFNFSMSKAGLACAPCRAIVRCVAAAVTDLAGSSRWFEAGFVTYSNAAKASQLGLAPEMIEREGAVSQATVTAMARGALSAGDGDVSLAVSGVAGPDGGTAVKLEDRAAQFERRELADRRARK